MKTQWQGIIICKERSRHGVKHPTIKNKPSVGNSNIFFAALSSGHLHDQHRKTKNKLYLQGRVI